MSNRDYNKKHGTQLEDVPQIARWKLYADDLPPEVVEDIENKKAEIKAIRERNNMQLYAAEFEAAFETAAGTGTANNTASIITTRTRSAADCTASCLMKDKVLSKQTQLTQ